MKRRHPVLFFITLLMFIFLYAPILGIVAFSFNNSRLQATWAGFTLKWYKQAFHDPVILHCLWHSAIVAFITTIICTVVGTLAGMALSRKFTGRTPTIGLVYLPILIPEIVLAIALILFIAWMKWMLSPLTLILSHVVFSVSYVAIVVRARLASFDPTLLEAARDLGANAWGTFWRVKFPLILPGIVAGAALAFTVSLDDYVITSFTAPPTWQTVPVYVYSKVKTGVTPEINAVSTLLLTVTMILILVTQFFSRPRGEKEMP